MSESPFADAEVCIDPRLSTIRQISSLIRRLRLKFCLLCDAVCDRADVLNFRRDDPARQKILDILAEWMQSAPEVCRSLEVPSLASFFFTSDSCPSTRFRGHSILVACGHA